MANVFTLDPSVIALWRMEYDAYTDDSKGNNILTPGGICTTSGDYYKEGERSFHAVRSYGSTLYLPVVDMDYGFPLSTGKDATDDNAMTIVMWFRITDYATLQSDRYLWAWRNDADSTGYHYCRMSNIGLALETNISGASCTTVTGLSLNQWYFLALCTRTNAANPAYRDTKIHCWDDTAGSWKLQWEQTQSQPPILTAGRFEIGTGSDGFYDEVVVFNRYISDEEIVLIKDGDYAYTTGMQAAIVATTEISGDLAVASFAPWFVRPQQPISEVLEWRTNVLKPHDGTEQRIAQRQGIPRQSFRFPYLVETDQANARLNAVLHSWLKRQWGVPIWTEQVEHADTLTAGASSITVDTTNADFRDDSYGLVWQPDQYEVLHIATKDDSSLSLSRTLKQTYAGPKWIMPLRQGWVTNVVKKKIEDTGASIVEIWLGVSDNILLTGHTPAMTYDGLEVLAVPSYADPQQEEFADADVILVDNETGVWEYKSHSLFNELRQGHLFQNDTKAACWSFRKFLHSLYGQQKTILIPTHRLDLDLTAQVSSVATTFNVANIGLTNHMGVNALRTYIAFATSPIVVRKVTGISVVDAAEEQITINTSPGVTIPVNTKVSFVDQCRLASDRVEIEWDRAHRNSCLTSFLRVAG